jgi:hypothetical protein
MNPQAELARRIEVASGKVLNSNEHKAAVRDASSWHPLGLRGLTITAEVPGDHALQTVFQAGGRIFRAELFELTTLDEVSRYVRDHAAAVPDAPEPVAVEDAADPDAEPVLPFMDATLSDEDRKGYDHAAHVLSAQDARHDEEAVKPTWDAPTFVDAEAVL